MSNVLIIVAVLLVSCIGARKRINSVDALSKEQGITIKGIAAVLLVLLHLGNALKYPGAYTVLSSGGFLLVAVFFFFSGYGVVSQSIKVPDYYKKRMPRKLLYLVKMVILTELVYLALNVLVLNKTYTFIETIQAIFGIKMLNGAMWYILALIIIYGAMIVLGKLKKISGWGYTAMAAISVVVYICICLIRRREPHEMQSCIAFVLGAFVAEKRNGRLKFGAISVFMIGAVCCASFALPYIVRYILCDLAVIRILSGSICSVAFVLLVLSIVNRIQIENKITLFLGEMATEIYLSHQMVINLVKHFFPLQYEKANTILLSCVIIVLVIAVSFLIRRLEILFRKTVKNVKNKKWRTMV